MRIAIVTETFVPHVNGIVRMLTAYLSYLQRHGHEAILFAPGAGPASYGGYEIVWISGVPFPLYPELVLAPYSTRMGCRLRTWQPDVVHLAGPFVLGMHGLSVARALGVPTAAHYQTDIVRYADHFGLGVLGGLAWRRLLAIHNAATVTFAPTPSVARDLTCRGMQRVHECGRGVDTDLFHPARRSLVCRAALTTTRDKPLLLYVGRLSVEKNVALLPAVARALPDYPLVVVGDGPARALLVREMADCNVHFTGVLHGADLAAVYASADIFLFPSETETFGQVVREAMASGLPVVGIRAGGVQDVIREGETGLLCHPGDRAGFIAAVRLLAMCLSLRTQMGTDARRDAERHSWDATFDYLMGWYAGLAHPQATLAAVGGAV